MITGKKMKNISKTIMIIGLAFMVITYIKTDDIKYSTAGLFIVSLGSFINHYAKKKIEEESLGQN